MRSTHLRRSAVLALTLLLVAGPGGSASRAAGTWVWPLVGSVIRGYDPPDNPYGSGHRGIDIAAPVGTIVRAVDAGTVTFAGKVGGQLFVTVNHGGGLASTYSWVSALLVRKNDHVVRGQPVATTGWGHADLAVPHLHFGVRRDGTYVDPMAFLAPLSVTNLIRLAPLDAGAPAALSASAVGRMSGLANPPPPSRAALVGPRRLDHAGRGGGVRPTVAAVSGVGGTHGRRGVRARASVPPRLVHPDRYR
jgi:hypothetical protein